MADDVTIAVPTAVLETHFAALRVMTRLDELIEQRRMLAEEQLPHTDSASRRQAILDKITELDALIVAAGG